MRMQRICSVLLCLLLLGIVGGAMGEGRVISLGDYRAIEIEYPQVTVTEEEIDEQIEFMRSLYATVGTDGAHQLPELSDDFAREKLGCDSVQAYRERLRELLLEEKQEAAMQEAQTAFLSALIATSEIVLDGDALTACVEEYRSIYQQYMRQAQVDWTEFCREYFAMSEAEFEEALYAQAEWDLSRTVVLEALVQELNIALDEAAFSVMKSEFQAEYGLNDAELAERYPDDWLRRYFREELLWQELLHSD